MLIIFTLLLAAVLLSGCSGSSALMAATSWPGVTIGQDSVIVSNNQIHALRPDTGSVLWRFPAEPDRNIQFYAPAAVSPDGDLIAGTYNNSLYKLAGADGRILWNADVASDRFIGAAVITDSLVIAPSADGIVYALELETGSVVWEFATGHAIWSAPAVNGEQIYVTSLDHTIYAIDLQTGTQSWSYDTGFSIPDSAVLYEDFLLAGTFGNQVVALDKTSGSLVWSFDTEGWVWATPAVHNGTAYFGDMEGNFFSVDIETGTLIEKTEFESAIATTPLIHQGTIVILSENGEVYARSLEDGSPIWQTTIEGQLLSDPVLYEDLLLVAPFKADTVVKAMIFDAGTTRWEFTPAE